MATKDKIVNLEDLKVVGDEVSYLKGASYEVTQKADIDAVTSPSSRKGNPIELTDAVQAPLDTLKITLEPMQDLHGYEKPWVGGSGNNLCAGSVKSETAFGLTLALADDGTFKVTGTYDRTQATTFYDANKTFALQAGTYVLSGTPNNDLGAKLVVVNTGTNSNVVTTDTSFTLNESATVRVGMTVPASANGKSLPSAGVVFKPMIHTATVTDPTYEPYSNICPITGYDNVKAVRTGKNLVAGSFYNTNIGLHSLDSGGNQFSVCYAKVEKGESYVMVTSEVNSVWGFITEQQIKSDSPFCDEYPDRFVDIVTYAPDGRKYKVITALITGWLAWRTTLSTADECAIYRGTELLDDPITTQTLSVNVKAANDNATVYGGTVTINRDGTGTLVVDRAFATATASNTTMRTGGFRFYYNQTPAADVNKPSGVISDKIPTATSAQTGQIATLQELFCYINNSTGGFNFNTHKVYASVAEMIADIGEIQFAYELPTPQSYPLTASQITTLLGYNRITTDGITMELTYRKDKYLPNDTLFNQLPTGTASGDMATFSDGADDLPLKKLTVDIQPKQDLHGYDKPWAGGAGKNLAYVNFNNDTPFTLNNVVFANKKVNGAIVGVNGDGTAQATNNIFISKTPVTAGTIYKLCNYTETGTTSTYWTRFVFRDLNGTAIDVDGSPFIDIGALSNKTITAPSNAKELHYYINFTNGSALDNVVFKFAVYEASSAPNRFEPYSNICPISGWDEVKVTRAGKNLLKITKDTTTTRGVTFTVNKNSVGQVVSIGVVGTASGGNAYFNASDASLIKAGSYILSGINGGGSLTYKAQMYDVTAAANTNYDVGSGVSFSPIDGHQYQYNITVFLGQTVNTVVYPMLREASQSPTYEPYAQSKAITFPVKTISGSSVYGGTLTVERDGSGTLVVDRAKVAFTGMQWAANGTFANTYDIVLPNTYPRHSVTDLELSKSLSNMYPWYSSSDVGNKDYGFAMSINNDLQFYVKDKDVATVEAANAKFTDLEICYPLHYPVTYSLTSDQVKTLLGNNTIWADCGTVTANYYLDGSKPKATTDFLYDLLIALNGTIQQWWAIEGETQTLTQNGLTITRNGTSGEIAFSGKANADTYILINGGTFEAANAPGEWAAMSGFYLYPASLMWSQTMKAPTGMRLIHSTAGWAFDLDMAEEMNIVGGMKLGYGYPDNDGPMYIKVASGTVIPDGYKIQFNLLGTERMD